LLVSITLWGANHVTVREVPASESGIPWSHDKGRSKERFVPEAMLPGVAIFDYNNDG